MHVISILICHESCRFSGRLKCQESASTDDRAPRNSQAWTQHERWTQSATVTATSTPHGYHTQQISPIIYEYHSSNVRTVSMSSRATSTSQDSSLSSGNPTTTTTGARGSRFQHQQQHQSPWQAGNNRSAQRRGLAPISTTAGSPSRAARLASPILSPGGRFSRHSPSVSAVASPTSAPGSPGHLNSLVTTQLNILLHTFKDDGESAQADKIRRLVHDNMEVYPQYFRRLLQSNAGAIFPGSGRQTADSATAGNYQLLVQEMQKILQESQQAPNIAEALDTNESDVFRDIDLAALMDHFRLDSIAKVALAVSCRRASKADLRTKGAHDNHPYVHVQQAAASLFGRYTKACQD